MSLRVTTDRRASRQGVHRGRAEEMCEGHRRRRTT